MERQRRRAAPGQPQKVKMHGFGCSSGCDGITASAWGFCWCGCHVLGYLKGS